MKTCEKCFAKKELSEFYFCAGRKDGRQGYCKECSRVSRAISRQTKAPDKSIERARYLAIKDSPKYKQQRRESSKRYRYSNRRAVVERTEAWRKKNLQKCSEKEAKRRATKNMAAPKWANDFFISEIYDLARRRSEMLGYQWHVDHIVPLVSPFVCGLHVEHNLRVIPAEENREKSNLYWPDMPERGNGALAGWCEV